MRRGDRLRWFAAGLVLPVLILLVTAVAVRPLLSWAQSDSGKQANSQQAEGMLPLEMHESGLAAASPGSPLVIPAADFSSDGGFPDAFFFDFETGYLEGGFACLKAPAYLPNGVTVDYVGASLYDNDEDDRVVVELKRVDVVSGAVNTMATLGTPWASTDIQSVGDGAIVYPEVSYPGYAYFLTICLGSVDHRLYSVRIYYTEP